MKSLVLVASTVVQFLISVVVVSSTDVIDPIVYTEQGRIIGKRLDFDFKELDLRKHVDVYFGIPYAEAPVGSLRFKPPVPKDWRGELIAKQLGNSCPQQTFPLLPIERTFDEDCLFLDVYKPIHTPPKAAVMFWIHGGGYRRLTGSVKGLEPYAMAAVGDVIIVTINYRLGALGFLSTGDNEAPGNMGMLDQIQAMKWVKKNIAAFGGDPDRVTIFGESAGGSSVSLHTLSPLSRGLFSGAIMQSGVAVSPWAVNVDTKNNAKRAFALGQLLGCNGEDSKQLVECLIDVPADDIVTASLRIPEILPDDPAFITFAPVVDSKFLLQAPSALIQNQLFCGVNIMAGYTADEGSGVAVGMYPSATVKPHLNATDFQNLLALVKMDTLSKHPLLQSAVDLIYFDDSIIVNSTDANYLDAFVRIYGDSMFGCPNDVYLRAVSEADCGSTYMYCFTHHPSKSLFNAPWSGAAHGDEIGFFGAHFAPDTRFHLTEEEVEMTVKMIKYWTNFAKTGNPNIASEKKEPTDENENEWPQFSIKDQFYQELSPSMGIGRDLTAKECLLWNDYLPKLRHFIDNLEECQQERSCKSHWTKGQEEECSDEP